MTTTMAKPITEQTPAEIDTVLASNWYEQYHHRMRGMSLHQSIESTKAKVAGGRKLAAWEQESLAFYERSLAEANAEITRLREEAKPYQDEYRRRGGWNRYYLVANTNGHVHRGMDCSTCYPTTEYKWLTDLSDCDEAAMVAQWGEVACTVCFPDAPTMKGFGDGTSAFAQVTAAEKAAKDAEKASRNAAKAAKILDPPVVVPDGYGRTERIETVAAAKQAIRDAAARLVEAEVVDAMIAGLQAQGERGWDDPEFAGRYATGTKERASFSPEIIATLSAALLAKDITQDEIDIIIGRATKKARKG